MSHVKLACQCGTVTGSLNIVPQSLFHVHCLCCDCQSFAKALGNEPQILDAHGGSELCQTYPQFMSIDSGHEHLAAIQLTEKGIYRWYATCCNMPVANTMTSAKMPFIGVSVKMMQFANEQQKLQMLGPVSRKAFGKYAKGDMPADVHPSFPKSYLGKISYFMLKGIVTRKQTPSPFFQNGQPIAKIERKYEMSV